MLKVMLAIGLTAIALGMASVGIGLQSVQAFRSCGPNCPGEDHLGSDAKHKAAEILRNKASEINDGFPGDGDLISKLNQRADRLDGGSDDGGGTSTIPCPPQFCE